VTSDLPPLSDADAPDEDGNPGRPIPHDVDAEMSCLGGMMLDPSVIDDVVEVLSPTDFWLPKHENIAKAIVGLHRAKKPSDVIAVTDELQQTGMISRAGGAEYLHTLTGHVPTAANAGYYASIVAEKAILRGLVEAGIRLQNMGYASEGEPAELVEAARAEVDRLAARRKTPVVRVGENLQDDEDYRRLIAELERPPSFLRTPWAALDELIGGFTPGGLYIFAARPGAGKSIALLQCASRLAHDGLVAFSSLEMQAAELQTRLFAQLGGVSMNHLRDHTMTRSDFDALDYARSHIVKMPIFIDDTSSASMTQIRSFVRSVSRHGRLGAAIVDYLQIVHAPGPDRQLAVSNTALDLKDLGKEHGIPVIAAAQLRRATMRGRGRQKPSMEDLRESGGIEAHADAVILIDRTAKDVERGEVTLIVGKARNGRVGEFQLRWEGHRSRMEDLGWSPTASLFGDDVPE
jgi:replicative DNA helicase